MAVAAAHRQHHRNAALAAGREDAAVALGQAGGADLQPPEPVALERVGAGLVEHQARRRVAVRLPHRLQRAVERLQVGRVGAAVGQVDVEAGGHLAEGIVLLAVHRQRPDAGVAPEDRRGAVALVHVQVDHRHPQRLARMQAQPLGLHQPRGHRQIVEDAVAAAGVRAGMVRAAGEVGGDALGEGGAGGLDGRADRAPGALGHHRRPGKSDLALRGRRQRAVEDAVDVGRRMRQGQLAATGRQRLGQPHLRQLGGDAVAQQAVLLHREAVPGGQRQHEVIGIEGLHAGIVSSVTNDRLLKADAGQPERRPDLPAGHSGPTVRRIPAICCTAAWRRPVVPCMNILSRSASPC